MRTAAFVLIAAVAAGACDLPTASPKFSVTPEVSVPLLLDKSFSVFPTDDKSVEPILDPGRDGVDTLFTDPGDGRTLTFDLPVQTLRYDDLAGSLDPLTSDFDRISVGLGGFEDRTLTADTRVTTEVYELAPGDPATPEALRMTTPVVPATDSEPLGIDVGPPLALSSSAGGVLEGATLLAATLTSESVGVNALQFTLVNGLGTHPLTAATNRSRPPRISVVQDGRTIGQVDFPPVPAGATRQAEIPIAGARITDAPLRFVLDVSTPSGAAPLQANPGIVTLSTGFRTLRYGSVEATHLKTRNGALASDARIAISDFPGDASSVQIASGVAAVTLVNALPVALRASICQLQSEGGNVPGWPNSPVALPAGSIVQARSSRTFDIDLTGATLAPSVRIECIFDSVPSAGPVGFSAGDGVDIRFAGTVEIAAAVAAPGTRTLSTGSTVEFDTGDLSFGTGDYVDLTGGTLAIREVENEFPVNFDRITLTLPGLRRAPYGPTDALTIEFSGTQDIPSQYRFRAIQAGELRTGVSVNLAGLRLVPDGSSMGYEVAADARVPGSSPILLRTDSLSARIALENLAFGAARAQTTSLEFPLTPDVGGDERYDLRIADEGLHLDFDSIRELTDYGLDGLPLVGSTWTLTINTNIDADFDLYLVVEGTGVGGTAWLAGRGAYAVASGDPYAARIVDAGAPVDPARMMRLPVRISSGGGAGSGAGGQGTKATITLDASTGDVDDFLAVLPDHITAVAFGVLSPNGGRFAIPRDNYVEITIGANVPVSVAGSVSLDRTFELDASSLEDLTDPTGDARVDRASLVIGYENGLPLGARLSFVFLDPIGDEVLRIPTSGSELEFGAAPSGASGHATGTTYDDLEIRLTANQVTALARATDVRLLAVLRPDPNGAASGTASLRASDRIRITLRGDFAVRVNL